MGPMTNLERIEIARTLLINAAEMNFSKDTLLKISQILDKYHVDYLKEKLANEDGFYSIESLKIKKNDSFLINFLAY